MAPRRSSVTAALMVLLWATVATFTEAATVSFGSQSIADLPPQFVGMGEEMWGYLGQYYSNVFINNTALIAATSAWSPTLRIGGITADFVDYRMDLSDYGPVRSAPTKQPRSRLSTLESRYQKQRLGSFWPTYNENVTRGAFETLRQLAAATGSRWIFDVNELTGRNCHVNNTQNCIGNWNTTNLVSFLTYIRDNHWDATPLLGFEMGNELTRGGHINMSTQVADYVRLNQIIQSIWPDASHRPGIFGPSTDICDETAEQFMEGTKSFLTAFTYHSYPGQNGSNSSQQLLDVNWLRTNLLYDDLHAQSYNCVLTWQRVARPFGVQLWLTESNSAYATDYGVVPSMRNGFWYTASLGQYAALNVSTHCRWSYCGDDPFATIFTDGDIVQARPDYYIALTHKRLMGTRVLNATTDDDSILVYAHCQRDSTTGVTLMYLNPSQSDVTITASGASAGEHVEAYVFTAPQNNLTSSDILLNGVQLALQQGVPPPLTPVSTTAPATVPPLSYGFLVFPNLTPQACQ